MEKTLEFLKQALIENPNDVACHNNLSNVYLTLNDVENAVRHLHQALRLDPQYALAYSNLGRILYKQGRILEAISNFEKALRINPEYWEAHYNLAHSLASQNQMTRSAHHYREVIRIIPAHPNAHFNLGLTYLSDENYLAAEEHLKQAFTLTPENTEAAKQLGHVYLTLGKTKDAIQLYEQILQASTDLADIHHNLAILYLRNEDREKALNHFKEAFRLSPTNYTAQHMITALSGRQTANAPTQYVTQLFDQYAPYYDEHVRKKLNYQVPGLLRSAVGHCLGNNPKAGRILDLGCGTGQCGVFFRDLALELIGVDLSSQMIEKAKQLGAYDSLFVSDLNEYLTQSTLEPFDLIIAGDVLVYSGDLDSIFKMVFKKLAEKGRFAFTIEDLNDQNLNHDSYYYLQPTGRFAHSKAYIQQLVHQNNFVLLLEKEIILREHEGNPIQGRVYVLS